MAIEIHKLLCVHCGTSALPMYIPRDTKHLREYGHLKKCYCLLCGRETNHAEINECGGYSSREFRLEWAYGNFNEKGQRIKPWREHVSQVRQQGYKELNKQLPEDWGE